MRVAPTLLCLMALASAAMADSSTSVAVVVNGPEALQQKTRDVVNNWFDTHGLIVESLPLPKDGLKTFQDCLVLADMTCARGVVEKRGRSQNIVGITEQVSGKGDKRSVQLAAYWIAKDHEVVSLQRTCDSCTDTVLAETLVAMIDDLAKQAPSMGGTLHVTSQPSGMKATIDNDAAGRTPFDRKVSFGQHVVSILRDERVVAQKKVTITPGARLDVAIEVPDEVKATNTITVVEKQSSSRAVPVVLVTVGLAAVVTGGVLYATGGPTGESYTYRNMRPAGIATGISGAVAITVGAIWYARTGNKTSRPEVSITTDATMIGWARSF